jgi:hypothetical protein
LGYQLKLAMANIARAKAGGVRFGRPMTIDAHGDSVVRLRAQGRTGRAIAKELGIPSSNVFRLIADLEKGSGWNAR